MTEHRFVSVTEAERLIAEYFPRFPAEIRPLEESVGCVLREEIVVERPVPPFNRVTMDGIAVSSRAVRQGIRNFRIRGRVWPGSAADAAAGSADECVEIMTGAALPAGYDAVVPYEDLEIREGRAIVKSSRVVPGQYVHRKGSDAAEGTVVLESGVLLDMPRVAAIAGAGRDRIRVGAPPPVALVSNGDEIVPPGRPVGERQVYAINNLAIRALLERHGIRSVSAYHCGDDPDAIEEVLDHALRLNDVVVISAGVSMGRRDLVPEVLARLGVHCIFHKVRQRPGKPLYFGRRADGRVVFGLPGNPVSAMVCSRRYVLPALLRGMGARPADDQLAELGAKVEFAPELTYFPPVLAETVSAGARLRAHPVEYHNSGHYLALAGSNGFVEIPAGRETVYPAGMKVRFFPWDLPLFPVE